MAMQPPGGQRIPVARPRLGTRELEYATAAIESSWISSTGEYLDRFEQAFADFCGVKHAIACSNGTVALHLALVALGVQPGDEVIVPDLTYIASANAVRYCHATPVFVDNDPRTFNIDPAAIEARITPATKGIIAVHLYGQPADMDPILEIAARHGLFVIEDAAEAHGALYKGRKVGGIGRCGTFSFFGNKIVTTGEGGAVTTDDDDLARRLRLFRGQGMDPERRYWFPQVGYNYRLTNLAAAIGVAQMERIEEALDFRRTLADWYDAALAPLQGRVLRPHVEPWAGHVYWMYTVLLGGDVGPSRDEVMARMDADGIETRPVFYPMHEMPPYAQPATLFPNATLCGAQGINLPTHEYLTEADVHYIAEALGRAIA